jgi:hypothetical protein
VTTTASDADAAFIVKAVNSHIALVEAMTELLAACTGEVCNGEAIDQARAALIHVGCAPKDGL